MHVNWKMEQQKWIWKEKQSDKLSSDLINLKAIRLKQSWYDENWAAFHGFFPRQSSFIIHNATFTIYHLRKWPHGWR